MIKHNPHHAANEDKLNTEPFGYTLPPVGDDPGTHGVRSSRSLAL